MQERTGRSRGIREELKGARKKRRLSLKRVAELVAEDLGISLSGEAVRLWENFERHPRIDTFASWARVLGYRLDVQLIHGEADRARVSVSADIEGMIGALELASYQQKALIRSMLKQMGLHE